MFTSGLDQLKLIQAFQLCREHDNDKVKRGEKMLIDLRPFPQYIFALMSFMTDPQQQQENKLMASTEIKKCTLQLDWEDENKLDEIALNLLHIYINASDRIAKHLRSVITELPISEKTIKCMADLDNGQVRTKLRLFKLYRKLFDDQEDDLFIDLSGQLTEAVVNELELSFENGVLYPLAVQYQMVKILESFLHCALDIFADKLVVDRWIALLLQIIKQAGTGTDKYVFKLKGAVFDCLNYLLPHNSAHPGEVFSYLNTILQIERQQPDLTRYCLEYLHSFIINKWWRNDPANEHMVEATIRRIAETAIRHVYDRERMLRLFKQEQQLFIQVFFECLNDNESLHYCRKILRVLVNKHFDVWNFYLKEGMKVGTITNMLLNFMCESAIHCSESGVKKHKIPLECLLKVSNTLLSTTIKSLGEVLVTSGNNIELPDEALVTLTCILRFYCYYRPYLPRNDLAVVISSCSKLALKCPNMRRLCYYAMDLLCDIILFTEPLNNQGEHQNKVNESYDKPTTDLILMLITDMSTLDSMDLQLKDLACVSMACLSMSKEFLPLEAQLKRLALTAFELCQEGGDAQHIRVACVIPASYIEIFRFEPEFVPYVKKLVEAGVSNSEISFIYILYFERFADSPKDAMEMYQMLNNSEFLDQHCEQSAMFAYILVTLVLKLELPPAEMRKVIGTLTKLLKRQIENNSCRTAEMIVSLLSQLFGPENRYVLEVNELYNWLFDYINSKRNFSGAGVALLSLMTNRPPSIPSLLQRCIPELLKVARRYGIADRTNKITEIIFTHFEKYFDPRNKASWRLWGTFLENLLKKIKNRPEKERHGFVQIFHRFQQLYHPEIGDLLREKYQIEMTTMMLEHSSIEV